MDSFVHIWYLAVLQIQQVVLLSVGHGSVLLSLHVTSTSWLLTNPHKLTLFLKEVFGVKSHFRILRF